MPTLTIILLTWYLLGAVVGLFLYHKAVPNIGIIDVFLFFTLGGLFGAVTVTIGILFLFKHGVWRKEPTPRKPTTHMP